MLRDREQGLATTPDIMAAALRHGGEAAFTRAVQDDLSASPYPPCLPTRTTVLAYRPEARELVIERELPRNSVIPPEQEYRIVKGTIVPVPRRGDRGATPLHSSSSPASPCERWRRAFALTPPALVDSVVLNGRVTAVDHATGQDRPSAPGQRAGSAGRGSSSSTSIRPSSTLSCACAATTP